MRIPFPIHLCLIGALLTTSAPATGQSTSGQVLIIGSIDAICVDDLSNFYSGGSIVVAGQQVIIPANLMIDLPANRVTLAQLFLDAPPASFAEGETGLAVRDRSRASFPGIATILANTTVNLTPIAGSVDIEKAGDGISGIVTYINYDEGYFRVNGRPNDPTNGAMVRINDPDGIHTIQSGAGCIPGMPNCSPDIRFGLDPENYTITYSTGYPAGIPSTVPMGLRPGFDAGTDNAAAASNAFGVGDPMVPATNRSGTLVPDATRFAPIQLGDHVSAAGGFHKINGVRFLAAHTVSVGTALTTANTLLQPDYILVDEAEIDVAGFANQRVKSLVIVMSTLEVPILDQAGGGIFMGPDLDVYGLHFDPNTGEAVEYPWASSHGLPSETVDNIVAGPGDVFKVGYDVDFIVGAPVKLGRSPCANLLLAGFTTFPDGRPICPSGLVPGAGAFDIADEFEIQVPVMREIIARSRHKQAVMDLGLDLGVRNINGLPTTWGEYLSPIGIGFPEFGEVNLDQVSFPNIFEGVPWLLDRALGPGGFDGSAPAALDPFPVSFLDPTTQAFLPINADRIFAVLGDMTVSHDPLDADFVGAPYPPATPSNVMIQPTVLGCGTAPLQVAPFGPGDLSGNSGTFTTVKKLKAVKGSR
jgi:hypothetical protein